MSSMPPSISETALSIFCTAHLTVLKMSEIRLRLKLHDLDEDPGPMESDKLCSEVVKAQLSEDSEQLGGEYLSNRQHSFNRINGLRRGVVAWVVNIRLNVRQDHSD